MPVDLRPDSKTAYSIDLLNRHQALLQLVIEPWGTVHDLPPREIVAVDAQGPTTGRLQIDVNPDRDVVHGRVGSQVSIFPEDLRDDAEQ